MRIKELSKETIFIKKIGNAFLVDETEIDGIRTVRTTKNPMKAKQFSLENIYPLVYNQLDEDDARRVAKAHGTNKDSYGLLSRYINNEYAVIATDDIDYGYGEDDIIAERKLLASIGMEHVCEDVQIVIESIDKEEN